MNPRLLFSTARPEIELARLSEPPFDVTLRELRGMIAPIAGERRQWGEYEYPDYTLARTTAIEVTGPGQVHDEECVEIRLQEHTPAGDSAETEYGYAAIRDGIETWFGWWRKHSIYTFKDGDFAWDWPRSPVHLVDAGQFEWTGPAALRRREFPDRGPKINPVGAGLWQLRLGNQEHRCLRFIEANAPSQEPHVLLDGFADETGRVLLTRHYYWEGRQMWCWDAPAREALNDAPTMQLDDVTYYLWYDRIPADAL